MLVKAHTKISQNSCPVYFHLAKPKMEKIKKYKINNLNLLFKAAVSNEKEGSLFCLLNICQSTKVNLQLSD